EYALELKGCGGYCTDPVMQLGGYQTYEEGLIGRQGPCGYQYDQYYGLIGGLQGQVGYQGICD
ncbi:MAG: hypothetical protein EZS28_020634, partial [Streblomastix strix]